MTDAIHIHFSNASAAVLGTWTLPRGSGKQGRSVFNELFFVFLFRFVASRKGL